MGDRYLLFIPGSTSPPKGPFSLDELRGGIAAKDVPPDARVSRVGDTTWVAISEVVPQAPEVVASPPPNDPPSQVAAIGLEPNFEVTLDGLKIVGPVTLDQIRRGIDAGKISADAKGRRRGTDAWRSVAEVLASPPSGASEATPAALQPSFVAASPKGDGPKTKVVLAVAGTLAVWILAGVGGVLTRADKAQPDYVKCVQADTAGDLPAALKACTDAVGADPKSTGGKAAADKLVTLTSRLAEKEKAEAEAKAKAEADAERASLLASTSVDDWRQLVTKYPDAEEAWAAAWKVKKHESMCAEFGGNTGYNFFTSTANCDMRVCTTGVDYVREYSNVIDGVVGILDKLDEGVSNTRGAVIALAGLGSTTKTLRKSLDPQCDTFRSHALLASEAPIRKSLLADCDHVKRMFDRLYSAIDDFRGLEPFLALEPGPHLAQAMIDHADKRQADCRVLAGSKAPVTAGTSTTSQAAPDLPKPPKPACHDCFFNGRCDLLQGNGGGACCKPVGNQYDCPDLPPDSPLFAH
jgi:hypothetical protein